MPIERSTLRHPADSARSARTLALLLACAASFAIGTPAFATCAPGQHDFYGTCIEQLSLFGQASWKETARGAVLGHTLGWHASGLAIDRSVKPNRIYVADTSNNRILGFRSLGVCSAAALIECTNDSDCAPSAAGTCTISGAFSWPFNPTSRDADIVIGQPDSHRSACNDDDNVGVYGPASASTLCLMQKGHLWFANHVFKLPVTTTARTPIASNVPVYWADDPDTQATIIGAPEFDPVSGKLWIADDHRVLRIANATDIESGDKLLVDMVLGQTTKSNACNQGLGAPAANRLCVVRSIRFDRLGNLYVIENDYECHGNNRITVFAAADIAAAQGMFPNLSATRVFGGTMTAPGPCEFSPVAVTFDSANRMVVANDGGVFTPDYRTRSVRQLFLFPTPLTSQVPSATIRVPMGAPGELQFDDDDNLVIRDHTWHRAWVVNLARDPTWIVPE